ncbi:hypothetical protein KIPB_009409, partial [Kipferlia bialata]
VKAFLKEHDLSATVTPQHHHVIHALRGAIQGPINARLGDVLRDCLVLVLVAADGDPTSMHEVSEAVAEADKEIPFIPTLSDAPSVGAHTTILAAVIEAGCVPPGYCDRVSECVERAGAYLSLARQACLTGTALDPAVVLQACVGCLSLVSSCCEVPSTGTRGLSPQDRQTALAKGVKDATSFLESVAHCMATQTVMPAEAEVEGKRERPLWLVSAQPWCLKTLLKLQVGGRVFSGMDLSLEKEGMGERQHIWISYALVCLCSAMPNKPKGKAKGGDRVETDTPPAPMPLEILEAALGLIGRYPCHGLVCSNAMSAVTAVLKRALSGAGKKKAKKGMAPQESEAQERERETVVKAVLSLLLDPSIDIAATQGTHVKGMLKAMMG